LEGIDATSGVVTYSDGTIYQATISWALPVVWPGAVYSLDVGIVGTEGVLTIDDTHRDIVLATSTFQGEGYAPDQSEGLTSWVAILPVTWRLGNCVDRCAETESWLNRVALNLPTPAATAKEAHFNLMMTKAFDLSARAKASCTSTT
jgi:hypothetical protein